VDAIIFDRMTFALNYREGQLLSIEKALIETARANKKPIIGTLTAVIFLIDGG